MEHIKTIDEMTRALRGRKAYAIVAYPDDLDWIEVTHKGARQLLAGANTRDCAVIANVNAQTVHLQTVEADDPFYRRIFETDGEDDQDNS